MLRVTILVAGLWAVFNVYAEQVSLRDLMETKFQEQDKRIEQAAQAGQEAKEILQNSTTRRLDLLFEAQKSYEAATYATREMLSDQGEHLAALDQAREVAYANRERVVGHDARIAALEQSRDIAYGAILAVMFVLGLPVIYLLVRERSK